MVQIDPDAVTFRHAEKHLKTKVIRDLTPVINGHADSNLNAVLPFIVSGIVTEVLKSRFPKSAITGFESITDAKAATLLATTKLPADQVAPVLQRARELAKDEANVAAALDAGGAARAGLRIFRSLRHLDN